MSINPITFGVPAYDPPFSVSTGDVDNLKLRSKETAPLSHESLDENFCNLANKINEILNLGISDVSITGGVISFANLQISGSIAIDITETGEIRHADMTPRAGYNVAELDGTTDAVINGIYIDTRGHVKGYKTRDIDLSGYATVSSLQFFVQTSDLDAYVTDTELSTQLANYATTSSLGSYATTSSLSSYATTTALATTDGNVTANTSSINTLTSSVSTNTTNISSLQTSVSTLDSEKLDVAALSFDSNTGTLTITTS